MQFLISPMRELPVGFRMKLRELTIGPVAWGLWSLTFHDGSTWAALAFDGEQRPENLVGWACVTQEYDVHPMIGAYVAESHRGRGVAPTLVTSLCRDLLGRNVLTPGDTVVASTWRWDGYYALLEECGLVCETWV